MTFGQGCPPLQTLPAQLETMLNAVTWDQSVEVVNGGVSGFSIHDAWHHYVKQLKLFNPDLIVIIICYNDAELYPIYESQIESQREMTYFEFARMCFDEYGQYYPYFVELLKDIVKYCADYGSTLALANYEIFDEYHVKCRDLLTRTCRDLHLPFIDLSQDFRGDASALKNLNLWASAVDGHPSATAHGIAAQRVVRSMLEQNIIASAHATASTEFEAIIRCIESTEAATASGADTHLAALRLQRSLQARRNSRVRNRMPEQNLLSEASYHEVTTPVRELHQHLAASRIWQRYADRFKADEPLRLQTVRSLVEATSKLEQLLPVFEEIILPVQSEQEMPHDESYNLPEAISDAVALMSKASSPTGYATGLLHGTRCRIADDNCKMLEPVIAELHRHLNLIVNLQSVYYRCKRLIVTQEYASVSSVLPQKVTKQHVLKTMQSIESNLQSLFGSFHFDMLQSLNGPLPTNSTSALMKVAILLTVENTYEQQVTDMLKKGAMLAFLEIKLISYSKVRRVTSDMQAISLRDNARWYEFELPYSHDGELLVTVPSQLPLSLSAVVIRDVLDRPTELDIPEPSGEYSDQLYRLNLTKIR